MSTEEQEVLKRWRERNKQTAPVKRSLSIPDLCAGALFVLAVLVIVLSGLAVVGVLP